MPQPNPCPRLPLNSQERRRLTRAIGEAYQERLANGWKTQTIGALPPCCVWAEDAREEINGAPETRWIPEGECDYPLFLTRLMRLIWRKVPDFRLAGRTTVVFDEDHALIHEDFLGTREDGKPCQIFGLEILFVNSYGEMTRHKGLWKTCPDADVEELLNYCTGMSERELLARLRADSEALLREFGLES